MRTWAVKKSLDGYFIVSVCEDGIVSAPCQEAEAIAAVDALNSQGILPTQEDHDPGQAELPGAGGDE